jgi:hypothetical protein
VSVMENELVEVGRRRACARATYFGSRSIRKPPHTLCSHNRSRDLAMKLSARS